MLDGVLLRMVEEATHAGYPLDAAAVLLIELEGINEAVEEQVEEIRAGLRRLPRPRISRRPRQTRSATFCGKAARTPSARWAAARPITIRRTASCRARKPSATLRFIDDVSQRYGLVISNIFHAGDGNLHPLILFDHRIPGQLEKVKQASDEILQYCISVGGSITGEHGVGMEKNEMMAHQFSSDTLDMIARFKKLFDPDCRLNPGKVLPTGRGCMEIRQRPGDLSL